MDAPRTCRLVTLGCKVNQYETQYVKELLEANGFREAAAGERADVCIVNTCTVTHEADAKGRQLIRRLAHENPGSDVVVMGCFAARDPDTVARLPGVTRIIPDKRRLLEELKPLGIQQDVKGITRFDGHRRAFVKVQDGCLLNCTFCIIPKVRPTLRSRPLEDILAEVTRLVERGCQEIVLTGIHLGHYGIDLSRGQTKSQWTRLWHLVQKLEEIPGDFRVRLSSLEAAEVRGELVEALASSTRVVPHLHLCLQSGSDAVLARMRRRYTVASFLERCRRLRQVLDQPAFTTDIIVGFPGESDVDFEATCQVVREVGFSRLHVFSYSPRRGTPAATFSDRIPPREVAERRRRLLAIEADLAESFARSLVGRQLDVLVEGSNDCQPGYATGTSCRYAPVTFPGHPPALMGKRVPVLAREVQGGLIIGEPVGGLASVPARVSLPVV